MSRYECQRCHATCFTTDPPHLCADLRKRLDRQEKAISLVRDVLLRTIPQASNYDEAATEVVKALAGRDLGA